MLFILYLLAIWSEIDMSLLLFSALKVIVGNKADCICEGQDSRLNEIAEHFNCDYAMQVSAKTGMQII